MPKDDSELSVLEQRVMLAILRLHPNGYGITIQEGLSKDTGKNYSVGSIYTALDRLEDKGFVKSKMGEATAERGGRKKQHFTLTAEGQMALEAAMNSWDVLRSRAGLIKGAFARAIRKGLGLYFRTASLPIIGSHRWVSRCHR
jgi:PadR family transcriptional regulator PadR